MRLSKFSKDSHGEDQWALAFSTPSIRQTVLLTEVDLENLRAKIDYILGRKKKCKKASFT